MIDSNSCVPADDEIVNGIRCVYSHLLYSSKIQVCEPILSEVCWANAKNQKLAILVL